MRLITGAVVLSLTGCVSQGTYDELKAERDLLAVRVAELETEVEALESEQARLEEQVAKTSQRRAALQKTYTALEITEGQELRATLQTSMGDVSCELWPEIAPKTVLNFVQLAEGTREWTDPQTGAVRSDPLYDGTVFHRVIEGFMVQGGDPLGTGRGGPGYRFEDEVTREVGFDRAGLLAMANAGPNTNGSQFFITLGPTPHLNMKHTIFGECDLQVVREIVAQPKHPEPRGKPWRPVDPVTIRHIDIQRL